MDILQIADKADNLVRKYQTRNPFKLVRYLDIALMFEPLVDLKGCFMVNWRNSYIFINDSMDDAETTWVLGHEIGHRILHYDLAKDIAKGLMEYSLYDMTATPEREANIFAAELLVDEEELLEYIYNYGYTIDECAKAMSMHPAFIALKIEILNARGHKLNVQDYDRNFLK